MVLGGFRSFHVLVTTRFVTRQMFRSTCLTKHLGLFTHFLHLSFVSHLPSSSKAYQCEILVVRTVFVCDLLQENVH